MLLVLRLGYGLDHGYSSARTGRGWKPGQERDVDDETVRYLTEHFPGAFVPVPARAPVARPSARAKRTEDALEVSDGHSSDEVR